MQHEIKKKLKKLFYFDQILFYDFLLCAESRKPSQIKILIFINYLNKNV